MDREPLAWFEAREFDEYWHDRLELREQLLRTRPDLVRRLHPDDLKAAVDA